MTAALTIATNGRGFYEFTGDVASRIAEADVADGVRHLFVRHTSASLLITENAAPAVRDDLERFFSDLVPDGDARFRHDDEGPDDMPAHVRSVLTQTTLTVPVRDGRLALGTWQGIFLWEHRHAAHRRQVLMTLIAAG